MLALVCGLYGCKPEIGDECSVSTDCSNAGERLCDTTLPGGYCTIFNCEPGTCPDEAVCVAFKNSPSSVCPDPQSGDRLRRTFCMRSCEGNGDCRSGYQCIDLGRENPWKATIAEYGDVSGKVCIVAFGAAPVSSASTDICEPAQGCSAQSCAGCCDVLGFCRSGTEALACGNAGASCVSCPASCAKLPKSAGGVCFGSADAGSDAAAPDSATTDAATDAGDAGTDAGDAALDAETGAADAATDA